MAKVARFSQDNQNPVGMIVASMLTEAQFQDINGTNWVLAYGQSVAGSTYATVTGSSTLPDLRGRTLAGKDNMGGIAANRLTSAGSGVNGLALGAFGGAETHSLQSNELASHSHGMNHRHSLFHPTAYPGANTGVNVQSVGNTYQYPSRGNEISSGDQKYTIAGISEDLTPGSAVGVSSVPHTHNSTAIKNFTDLSGSSGAHNNTQPTAIINYFIKIN